MHYGLGRKLAAEFLGTFWLVFGGCGSAVISAAYPQLGIGFMGVAFAFGLASSPLAKVTSKFINKTISAHLQVIAHVFS